MELFRAETNWVVPFLHVLILDTRMIAARVRDDNHSVHSVRTADWCCSIAQADREASEKAGDEIHDSLVGLRSERLWR